MNIQKICRTKHFFKALTPNIALRSGSLNLKGMFDTCNLFGWFFVGSCTGVPPLLSCVSPLVAPAAAVTAAVAAAFCCGAAAAVSDSAGCSQGKAVAAAAALAGLLFTMVTAAAAAACCSAATTAAAAAAAAVAGWGGGLNGGPAAAAGGGRRGTAAVFSSAGFTSPFWVGKPAGAAAPNGAVIPVWTMCWKENRNCSKGLSKKISTNLSFKLKYVPLLPKQQNL